MDKNTSMVLGTINRSPTPEKFENAPIISTVRPTFHTNPSRKQSFSKNSFQTGRIREKEEF